MVQLIFTRDVIIYLNLCFNKLSYVILKQENVKYLTFSSQCLTLLHHFHVLFYVIVLSRIWLSFFLHRFRSLSVAQPAGLESDHFGVWYLLFQHCIP
jgi:hypothetical protein